MFEGNSILALDIGASKVVVAEFSVAKAHALELVRYGVGALELDSDKDANPSVLITATIQQVIRDNKLTPGPLLMTVSGQSVFPRFVKLPPVTRDKVFQIVQYEAEQNVPFPINEVVWDYQLIEGGDGELSVMLVAVKIENIKSLTDCVVAAGMEPEVVDVAPMALYNAVRYNYPDLQGCTMVLDIGARPSDLILMEENRIFCRSIPVAGNTITQEIAKDFGVSFREAEEIKLQHAMVSAGGVYAGPDSEVADRVSKIVRNVFTRLHAEVNRSVNFYRGQQGGGAPALLLLSGGSAVIPNADRFFREKLKMDVEMLNPFVNVSVSPRLDSEKVAGDMQLLGGVVGLGLRRALTCPVEINLMPPDIVEKKVFRRRQPFFILGAVGLVLILLCWWMYFFRMRTMMESRVEKVEQRINDLSGIQAQLAEAKAGQANAQAEVDALRDVLAARSQWIEMVDSVRSNMVDGMWIQAVEPVVATNQMLTHVIVKGAGFADKMRQADTPEATAIDGFLQRLRASEYFLDSEEETKILQQPVTEFSQGFVIQLGLERPMKVW